MRRGRIWIFLLLIVVILVGGAMVLLGGNFLQTSQATPTPAIRFVNVIVASQSVQRGSEISADMLGFIEIPEDKLVDVMITDPELVIGKLAKYPLEPGVPLTTAVLVETAAELAQGGSAAAKLIPPGLTAISIPITRLGAVGYALRDGDRVDVLATMLIVDIDPAFQTALPNLSSAVTGTGFLPDSLPVLTTFASGLCQRFENGVCEGNSMPLSGRVELDASLNQAFYVVPNGFQYPRMVTQRILQNVQVLKVGTFSLTDDPNDTNSVVGATPTPAAPVAPGTAAPAVERPDIVTLIVSPQDAVTLTYLLFSNAEMTLTLRGLGDQSRVETEAATLQFLLSQYAIPVPAKLPYANFPSTKDLRLPLLPNDIITVPAQ